MNNRQNGRRRGRGGQQPRNGQPGIPDRGNRLDNRARGNAAQLLEKYKSLARDAQMAGDRVNTEYYLQFADHYFRILAETRSRFEENRPAQRREDYRDDMGADDMGDDGDNDGARGDGGWNDEDERAPQQQQPQSQPHQPRYEPRPRIEAQGEGDAAPMRDEGERYQDRRPRRDDRAPRPARPPREAQRAEPATTDEGQRIEIDRLPAGFGTAPAAAPSGEAGDGGEEARPRRRTRRPRGETTVEA